MPTAYVYIIDRIKDMIITGGENVYSAEVENAVATHPAVANCALIGLPDQHWGERVHAVAVCKAGAQVSEEEIRAHAKALIAGYKVPRTVEFVENLPLTPTGKVLKRELRASQLQAAAHRMPSTMADDECIKETRQSHGAETPPATW
ncbi:MAG: AMP-binding enzyme [Pseudonocardiaceae bacterium]